MKKVALFLGVIALMATKCETDEPVAETPFPTDNLTVDSVQTILVIEQTGTWCQYCPNGAEELLVLDAKYGDAILPLAVHNGDPITVPSGVLLDSNYKAPGVPNFFVMNEDAGQSPDGLIAGYLTLAPKIGLKHTVVETDSSYNVYVKVEVFEDSFGEAYLIQSYLVLDDLLAKDYGNGLDLNQTSSVSTVTEGSGSTPTRWVQDAAFLDGIPLVNSGDDYYHKEVLYTAANTVNPWGKPLADINPFGSDYIRKDVYGTRYTPIILSIPRNSLDPFETGLSVATIIWRLKTDGSGDYEYVNGYKSNFGQYPD